MTTGLLPQKLHNPIMPGRHGNDNGYDYGQAFVPGGNGANIGMGFNGITPNPNNIQAGYVWSPTAHLTLGVAGYVHPSWFGGGFSGGVGVGGNFNF